jgi:hypothetical protein
MGHAKRWLRSLAHRVARELPGWCAMLGLVGEAHDVSDGLLVAVAAGRDLLVDLESERRVGVSDLGGSSADARTRRAPPSGADCRQTRSCADPGLALSPLAERLISGLSAEATTGVHAEQHLRDNGWASRYGVHSGRDVRRPRPRGASPRRHASD